MYSLSRSILSATVLFCFACGGGGSGDVYYFEATDGEHGWELWRSNGTEAGTFMVVNISDSGSSSPYKFTEFDGMTYFVANDETFNNSSGYFLKSFLEILSSYFGKLNGF